MNTRKKLFTNTNRDDFTNTNRNAFTNILIVGNGFDLAHKLPTTYKDFFNILSINKEILTSDTNEIMPQGKYTIIHETIIKLEEYCQQHSIDYKDLFIPEGILKPNGDFHKKLINEKIIKDNKMNVDKILGYFKDIKDYNIWYKIVENKLHQYDEKWVDFEELIKDVIKSLDKDTIKFSDEDSMTPLDKAKFLNEDKQNINITRLVNIAEHFNHDIANFLKKEIEEHLDERKTHDLIESTIKPIKNAVTQSLNKDIIGLLNKNDKVKNPKKEYEVRKPDIFNLIHFMEKELDEFTSAFEIYVHFIVKAIHHSPATVFNFHNLIPKHIINFNYTDTYYRIYEQDLYSNGFLKGKTQTSDTDIDFVHGEAGKNNLVLGIDEYLPDEDKNSNLYFVRFKKYFQRIYKKTGCKYKKWLEQINENSPANVYIIGHSLDQTDKDILREIILHENVTTTVFYYSPEAYDEQIINMIKLIGQDKLTDMVYGENPKIIFRDQEEITLNGQKTAI